MPDLTSAFKRCINQACELFRVMPAHFARQRGLRDLLIDMSEKDLTSEEIAALALEQLCEQEAGPLDGVVCLAVIEFLDERLGKPTEDPDRVRRASDLKALIARHSSAGAEYRQWIRTWYG